ncbi:MAG TPA: hypothetical protein VN174_04775 [Candidatus Methanoperedens sp.]|nr:hypothetical protein [Candidatus Methanoperedens sp.]
MVLPTTSKSQKIIFIFVFIFCLFIQLIPVIRSGLHYDYGVGFWGSNGHDGIWHLSLINHIDNPLKINMPIFSGESLKNYHPFFNILIAYLSKYTFIDSSIWLFQIFPTLSAIIFLYFSFLLGWKLSKSFFGGLLLVILNSISNSLGWIVNLIRFGTLDGESLFWAMQSPSNQLNPPFMLSILLILILIYILKTNKASKISIFLILSLLPIIKVYSAIPAYIIFFFYVLKNRTYLKTLLMSLLFALILFFQYNSNSASLIKFQPFWFINSMMESKDRLFLPKIANIRYTLEASNRIGPRLIVYYLATLSIFLVGNFSWRLLSVKEFKKNKAIFVSILICTLIPILFVQKGTTWNTIQFLYYALFLANIPLSQYLSKHRHLAYLVIILSLIPLYGSLPNYLGKIPPTAISKEEFRALSFLKQQPSGNVLTYPYDPYLKESFLKTPLPIYAYETTSYVAAYSGHSTFLEDEMNLDNSSFDWRSRRQEAEDFFTQKDKYQNRGTLVNNKINYIYLPKIYLKNIPEFTSEMSLTPIFDNSEIVIYKVNR